MWNPFLYPAACLYRYEQGRTIIGLSADCTRQVSGRSLPGTVHCRTAPVAPGVRGRKARQISFSATGRLIQKANSARQHYKSILDPHPELKKWIGRDWRFPDEDRHIIVNYNSRPYLETCLTALLLKTTTPFEVIIVDNASTDDSLSYLKELTDPRLQIILNPTNKGFAAACNQGLKISDSDLVVTMNPDVIVPHNWLPRLAWHLKQNKKTLIVGPKSKGIGGRQWAGPLPASGGLESADKKISRLYRRRSERTKFLIGCLFA